MVDHPEPDDSRFTDQSAYPRQHWHLSCEELGIGDDEWNLFANPPLVPAEDRPGGFYSDVPGVLVAR